jgi:hypothetical protein
MMPFDSGRRYVEATRGGRRSERPLWRGPLPYSAQTRGVREGSSATPIGPVWLMGRLHAFQEPDVLFGQSVGSCTVPKQHEIAERRFSIDVLTLGHVCDGRHTSAVRVFDLDEDVAITPAWHSFRRIQSHQIAPRDPVQHPPDLGIRIEAQICRCSSALGPAAQIEP